jgi:hypothetical protein
MRTWKARWRLPVVLCLIGAFAVEGLGAPASAATGTVTVTATVNATITISIADTTAAFGTNLDPLGTDSNSADGVTDVQSAGTPPATGSYYIWKTGGVAVTVGSNATWNGTVAASANSGTSSSMTIASGVLRWKDGSAPASYSDCSSATSFNTAASTWKSAVPRGNTTYTTYYCLRDDWTDDPGTFASTVTYTAT